MAAAESFMKLLHDAHASNSTLEQRIASLESQLQGLLRWQQSSGASKKKAQAASKGTKDFASSKGVVEKEPIVTVKQIVLTPPATPGFVTPPLIEEETPAVAVTQVIEQLEEPETDSTQTAYRILDVIQKYGQHLEGEAKTESSTPWAGRAMFAPKVENFVLSKRPIQLILPSFPWKSVSLGESPLQAFLTYGRSTVSTKSLVRFQILERNLPWLDSTTYVEISQRFTSLAPR